MAPLSVGNGQIIGVLAYGRLQEESVWPETAVRQPESVVQIFANAPARQRIERQLGKNEVRLSLAKMKKLEINHPIDR